MVRSSFVCVLFCYYLARCIWCSSPDMRSPEPSRNETSTWKSQAFLLGSPERLQWTMCSTTMRRLCAGRRETVLILSVAQFRDPRFHARGVEDCRVRASSGRASSLELEHRFSAGASSTLVQRAKVTRGSVNEHECRVLYWQSIVDQWPAFLASISVRWVSPSERCLLGEGLSLVVPATMCSSPFSRGTC